MKVELCDICRREIGDHAVRFKAQREEWSWSDHFRYRIVICHDCEETVRRLVRKEEPKP